ncbi:MarR family winged helix-turn-helix transcriptional regulator [Advenella mimigardefordensis]|uniref:Transcriptional regulator, MarR family n=1 Tax=Advenella mimigardefordensis (strain DSM 17166 / LMG 22922 / DPN7) TaxID=1247726 RepID=W0P9L5_ADVMD|nr:MarR family transcriptional regulator [Advenella mimigardefordensis]AHG63421.1 transcriptional regulator, MarR family [Advenella mimigardefordensis DPN7]
MKLAQKYQALLQDAERRHIPNVDSMRVCFQTLSLATAIDRECADQLAPHGLSEGRFVLLFLLDAAKNGLAPNVLAQQAGVKRATITGLLDGLEREGLIERQLDSHDRRGVLIVLTSKGKQLAKTVVNQHSHWIAGIFGTLSTTEQKQLSTLLDLVAQALPRSNESKP